MSSSIWIIQIVSKIRARSPVSGRTAQKCFFAVCIANCRRSAVDLTWPDTGAFIRTKDPSRVTLRDATKHLSSGVHSPFTFVFTQESDHINVNGWAVRNPSVMYAFLSNDLTFSPHHSRATDGSILASALTSVTSPVVRKGTKCHGRCLIPVSVGKQP